MPPPPRLNSGPTLPTAGSVKFTALESWRGLCALGVAMLHFSGANHFQSFPPIINAGRGVDFFFVLSGFVMAHAYGERLRNRSAAAGFLIRRLGRLYPLHLATLVGLVAIETAKLVMVSKLGVDAGAAPFSGETSWDALAANLVLLNGVGIIDHYSWNIPSWSISTEFWAYVLFLLVCLCRRRAYRFAAVGLAVLSGLALLWNEVASLHIHIYQGIGLLRCLCPQRAVGGLASGLEAASLGLAALVFWDGLPWPSVTTPLAFGFVVLAFAFDGGVVSRILAAPGLLRLGVISYSIYLVHFPILSVLNGICRVVQGKLHIHLYVPTQRPGGEGDLLLSFGNPWITDAAEIAYVAFVVAMATLTYRWIEDPARRYFNRIAASRWERERPEPIDQVPGAVAPTE